MKNSTNLVQKSRNIDIIQANTPFNFAQIGGCIKPKSTNPVHRYCHGFLKVLGGGHCKWSAAECGNLLSMWKIASTGKERRFRNDSAWGRDLRKPCIETTILG